MFKYPVLIGLPRSGTNWVQQYIRTAYSRYGMTLPSYKDDELFGKHYKYDNIQTKIRLLEIARANGLEICVKYLTNYVLVFITIVLKFIIKSFIISFFNKV